MINQDQLMSQLEDQFLDEDDPILLDDWEELDEPTPCDFTGKSYHRSFCF